MPNFFVRSLPKNKLEMVDGQVRVSWMYRERTHQCFLMEPAELNLGEYLEKEKEISLQQRLSLCADLIRQRKKLGIALRRAGAVDGGAN